MPRWFQPSQLSTENPVAKVAFQIQLAPLQDGRAQLEYGVVSPAPAPVEGMDPEEAKHWVGAAEAMVGAAHVAPYPVAP